MVWKTVSLKTSCWLERVMVHWSILKNCFTVLSHCCILIHFKSSNQFIHWAFFVGVLVCSCRLQVFGTKIISKRPDIFNNLHLPDSLAYQKWGLTLYPTDWLNWNLWHWSVWPSWHQLLMVLLEQTIIDIILSAPTVSIRPFDHHSVYVEIMIDTWQLLLCMPAWSFCSCIINDWKLILCLSDGSVLCFDTHTHTHNLHNTQTHTYMRTYTQGHVVTYYTEFYK